MSHDVLSAGVTADVAAYSHVPQANPGLRTPDVVCAWNDRQSATAVKVEIAEGAQLAALDDDWRDLVSRADAPNVFMTPAIIKLAGEADPRTRHITLLAWQGAGSGRRLAGVWAFAIKRAPQSMLPMKVLAAPAMAHGYLATPVIDRALLDATIAAMIDTISSDSRLPSIVVLEAMGTDGATMQALNRVLHARGSRPCVLAQANRPKLASALDGNQYLQQALSSSSRKKLRQHRRRLAEKGALEFRIDDAPEAVAKGLETFLQLEAAGWKGRQHTALLSNPADATFARGMLSTLAQRGDAAIHGLYRESKPVSMQLVLRAGPAAFTWKTTYDETWHDYSPGTLLLEDYTTAFLADESIAYVDSCAFDETSFMATWTERQSIATLWFDAQPGRSIFFAWASRIQMGYAAMRAAAKQAYRKHGRRAR